MKRRPWIAFFSQTGAEIADLSERLGIWPDVIITNERPSELRRIDERIYDSGKLCFLPNRPEVDAYLYILDFYRKPIITLHGWLRIMPPYICGKHEIYNGHPGLITRYPELKGKDPQIRAFEGKYKTIGAVLHRVIAGVDEGKVIMQEEFNGDNLTLDETFRILRDRSLYMWSNFLREAL